MKKIAASLFVILSFSLFNLSSAEEVSSLAPTGFVNDYAGVLSSGARMQVEGLLRQIEDKTTAEVTVVTVKTTGPLTIEQYAVKLFEKWAIGKKEKDNGVLILLAAGDRKVRIEVGYGLEGAITDLQSKMIIEELMVPAFKKSDYDLGVSAASVMIAKLISAEYGVQIDLDAKMADMDAGAHTKKSSPLGSLITLLFFILIFGVRFGPLFFIMGGSGNYWSSGSGGSFGGGFGGFGGGSSGGGGASGSW